jgi:hypothetical protein
LARRTFDVVDVTEILIHWPAARSQSQIASSLGLDRKTVKKYLVLTTVENQASRDVAPGLSFDRRQHLDRAIGTGLRPGGPERSPGQWGEAVRQWFPQLTDTSLRQITWPQIEVHRDVIVATARAGVSRQTIWQRLRDEHGLSASISSLKRYMDANLPEESLRNRVTVLRDDPPAARKPRSIMAIWDPGWIQWAVVAAGSGRS